MRTLPEIVKEIRADWKKVSPYALPYLSAMTRIENIYDKYGVDEGRAIVCYFLANCNGWRGEVARKVKRELNEMVR